MAATTRPLLGLSLSLVTVACWGMLPLGLKALLVQLDPLTITWARFLAAGLVVGVGLQRRGEWPALGAADGRARCLFLGSVLGLLGNYVIYLWGLAFIEPGAAQLVVQLAPMTLLLGSLVIYREPFSGRQWLGVACFFLGLGLFFETRLVELASGIGDYAAGVGFVVLAALFWGAYALAQKALLVDYASRQVLVVVYLASGVLLLPVADPAALGQLDGVGWGLLFFCCLNTLLAYGCLAEAMTVWESSRVSAVITLTPVATLAFSFLASWLWPGSVLLPELGGLALPGAALVVIGSLAAALEKPRPAAI